MKAIIKTAFRSVISMIVLVLCSCEQQIQEDEGDIVAEVDISCISNIWTGDYYDRVIKVSGYVTGYSGIVRIGVISPSSQYSSIVYGRYDIVSRKDVKTSFNFSFEEKISSNNYNKGYANYTIWINNKDYSVYTLPLE